MPIEMRGMDRAAVSPAGGMAVPDRGALPLSGVTVLLVEDSRFTSDALRLMCQRSGARMRRVETLAQAQAHLLTYKPDVVIVDLGLPDGRGEDLIQQLSGRGLVVLAASGDPAGRSSAMAAGAAEFIGKPLPGLGAFQRLLLAHLPRRFVIPSVDSAKVHADPLALQDDLRHALTVLSGPESAEQRRYLAGFLTGLARSTEDTELRRIAGGLAGQVLAMGQVRQIILDRLGVSSRL